METESTNVNNSHFYVSSRPQEHMRTLKKFRKHSPVACVSVFPSCSDMAGVFYCLGFFIC